MNDILGRIWNKAVVAYIEITVSAYRGGGGTERNRRNLSQDIFLAYFPYFEKIK
jgi:hypothetical protein